MPRCGIWWLKTVWKKCARKDELVFKHQLQKLALFLMQDDGRQNISWRLDLDFRMARAVQEPELDQCTTTWCGREGPLAIAVQTHPNQEWDLWGLFQDQEPRSWHESPWVLQTCPWTQFPGNRLILSWKVEKGSYYLTQPVRRHWAMIENSAGKMRP